jgi:hypothetical protein
MVACNREQQQALPSVEPRAIDAAVIVDATMIVDAAVIDAAVIDAAPADAGLPGGITGQATGKVTTPATRGPGEPIVGCTVRTVEQTTKATATAKTDAAGRYRIALPPGTYRVDLEDCRGGMHLGCGDDYSRRAVFTAVIESGNWRTIDVATQTCNKCLDATARIATPDGLVAVSELRIGDRIVVVRGGTRAIASVAAIQRIPVTRGARATLVVLADGRNAIISAPHPLSDGRLIGDIHVGDRVDGAAVVRIEPVAYADDHAYDLLPSIDGAYLVGGIPMRSTMTR